MQCLQNTLEFRELTVICYDYVYTSQQSSQKETYNVHVYSVWHTITHFSSISFSLSIMIWSTPGALLPLVARWSSASKLSSLGSKSSSPGRYKSSGLVGRKYVNSTNSTSVHCTWITCMAKHYIHVTLQTQVHCTSSKTRVQAGAC